jgi:hypothetical protein
MIINLKDEKEKLLIKALSTERGKEMLRQAMFGDQTFGEFLRDHLRKRMEEEKLSKFKLKEKK